MERRHREITNVNFTEFKGLANYRASNRSDNRYAYYGKNCYFDQGKIKSSPGHDPFLTALTGGTNYRRLSKYEYNTGGVTTEYLATLYNKEWYVVDTENGSRTALSAGLSTDEDTDCAQYINTLYTVSPTVGGGKISDPTTYSAVATMPLGSMIEFAWEKMWVSGVIGAEATVYGSRTATASNIGYVEDFSTNAQTELVGKGGKNTALRFLKDTLYVFKKDSIHFIKPQVVDSSTTLYLPKPFSVTGGAVNQKSTIVVENDIWFLTPDLQIRALGGVADYGDDPRTRDISSVIRNIKNDLAVDQGSVARAHYHDSIYTIALAEKGSPYANIVVNYNVENGGFGIDRFPSVSEWATVNNKVFMATVGSGQLYRDRFGYSFGGNFEIPFEVHLAFTDFQRPDLNYRNRRIYIRGARSKGVALTIRLYRGNYNTYSDYIIPEPTATEMDESSVSSPIGSVQFGEKPFGGSSVKASDQPAVFTFEKHISTSKISNMFAVGIFAELNGQRVEIDQLELGILPASTQPFNL
uniref:Uncharacterized protein n=1 Tax=viral metagenome TaxID=1070528 RepID=A0A6M3J709_9ZZZZ